MRKIVKRFIITIIVTLLVSVGTIMINIHRLSNQEAPLFVIHMGGSNYLGLGYNIEYVKNGTGGIYVWGGSYKMLGEPNHLHVIYYINYK